MKKPTAIDKTLNNTDKYLNLVKLNPIANTANKISVNNIITTNKAKLSTHHL